MQYEQKHKNNYIKFSAMIATAMVAMFFLTYNHSYQIISRSSRISAVLHFFAYRAKDQKNS